MSSNAVIVLAAGSSQRLGSPKQLFDLDGKPLLGQIVADVMAWPVDAVVVVLGASADAILDAIDFGNATVAINDAWTEGLASSLRVGLDVLARDPKWDRAFVALGNQPCIPETVPGRLLTAAEASRRPAIVPVYRYERGNPVLFDRFLWPRLMTLTGDTAVTALLSTHPEWVEEVRVPDLSPRYVDTAEDIADFRIGKSRGTGPSGPSHE